jgi:thiol-disulfide isomerase/thioredoxin
MLINDDVPKIRKMLKANKPILILFYMNGCHYCNELMPSWDNLVERNPGYNFGKIEARNVDEFRDLVRVDGYPTMYYHNNKKYTEFKNNRTVEDLEKFIKSFHIKKGGKTVKRTPKRNKRTKTKKSRIYYIF